jgi:predicted DCC family thiol-disulfide oxidoreductase YuxK
MMSSFLRLDGRLLVVFDGNCALCNRMVRWFLRRDRLDRLRFAASGSPAVVGLLARHKIGTSEPENRPGTILVVREFEEPAKRVMVRSDAVLALLGELPRPWPSVAAALCWIPRPLRDLGYRLIAHWRYRIWGRLENCPLPTPEERVKFL